MVDKIKAARPAQITASLIENKLFDQSIVGIFPKDQEWIYYLLVFFNSPTCNKLIRTINPSANNSANYVKKIPLIYPPKKMLGEINKVMKGIVEDIKNGGAYRKEDELTLNDFIRKIYGF